MSVRGRHIIRIVVATAFLLLVPLLAMQITDEVVWDLADFAVAGVLLVGIGLMYKLAASRTKKTAYRVAVGVALATGFVVVWMNLAVGLIGNQSNPANLMYIGVLGVGLIGAVMARLQPRGMARALFATALAQTVVLVIAMNVWKCSMTPGLVGVNVFFVALWVGSGLLFLRATAGLEVEPPTE